ncbi:hypothetical protein GUJ93_ZPchr0002g24109 [Zizania palustris]|uniref:RRM domain-containing protein n=1 Tax=Zizania palustris TaxID=103762 RepID=A0A8J5V431_ZIZPA|nr:hypothetical protein GUJ93_ZPchr0002g24109 [Zizania palustris]
MGNEITRLTAVKAFAVIAKSPLRIDLSCVLDHVISELTAFLRKANRALRQATLGTLNSLVVAYGGQIGSSSYETIIAELSTLISDMDLHMTALALELCCTIMADRKSVQNVGLAVRYKVLPQALILIRSALLQGQALQALQRFFASLSGGLAKQALSSIAQCVAVLCLAAGDQKCASTIEMLKGILKDDSATNSAKQHMALLCLGEIGRRKDLSNHAQIENIVIESFQSPFEEIKSAASYALGNIAVGNLSKYLPFILNQIDNQQRRQYLLLHSLKEVIARQSVDHTGQSELQDSNIEKILALLFNHCESEEEGVRNVVAECLGKIALIEPRKLIPALKERTSSPAANTRATVAIAIKYSIVERPGKIDEIMYPEISTFLMLIKDSDRHVRRAAVLALSTAAHNKPNLIKGLLPELLPLYDGLELRKAAFECVDTLLDSCLDQVNPSSFIVPFLLSGLGDHYDVKMPCHLILSKLADKCPSAVLAVLDSLVEPIEKTINHRPKGDAVKQEVDRNEDMIRSALRAIAALSRISGSDYSMRFKNLMNKIMASPPLADKYNSIDLNLVKTTCFWGATLKLTLENLHMKSERSRERCSNISAEYQKWIMAVMLHSMDGRTTVHWMGMVSSMAQIIGLVDPTMVGDLWTMAFQEIHMEGMHSIRMHMIKICIHLHPLPATCRLSLEDYLMKNTQLPEITEGIKELGVETVRSFMVTLEEQYHSSHQSREDSYERDHDYEHYSYGSDHEKHRRDDSWRRRDLCESAHEKRGFSHERDRSPYMHHSRSRSRGHDDQSRSQSRSRSPRGKSRQNQRDGFYDDNCFGRRREYDWDERRHGDLVAPSATVVVKGLSQKTNEDDLNQILADWGPLRSVRVIKERSSGMSRGFAFIDFPTVEAARRMEGTVDNGLSIDGRKVFCQYSSKPTSGMSEPSHGEENLQDIPMGTGLLHRVIGYVLYADV